jgi:hypothetical protein
MQRSKQQALMFLLGAVLVGGALGFSAERVMGHKPERLTERQYRDQFYQQLGVRSEQGVAIDSILDERDRQWDAVMKTVRPRLDSIREHGRNQIRQRLDAEQRQRFEQFLAEQTAARQANAAKQHKNNKD